MTTQISEAAVSQGRNSVGCHQPEITYKGCPFRYCISGSAEQYSHVLHTQHEEGSKQNSLGSHAFSDDVGPSPGGNFLHPSSKDCVASNSVNRKMKPPEDASACGEKKFGDFGPDCPGTSVCTDKDCLLEHHSGFSQLNNVMFGHFQKNIQGSQRFSFDSMESGCTIQTESSCRSFLEAFPSENFKFATFSPNVGCPHPFSKDSQSDWSGMNSPPHSEVTYDSMNSPPHSSVAATVGSDGCQEKCDKSANRHHNKFAAKMSASRDRNGLNSVTPRVRESLPINHSSAGSHGIIRTSSLKESSAARQLKCSSLDRHNGDKATDSSRARRSPLRRLLDPLLKPTVFSRTHPVRLAAGSTGQHSCEGKLHGLHGSYSACTSSDDGTCEKGSTSASWVPLENHSPMHDEKHETPTKHALMQIAWKNGLPLLTFSVNESDILTATRRKGSSVKQDCDYIYTFYYVRETKKKTGGWISQGNKRKGKELFSRVVGQMNVSCLRCPTNHIAFREFVLFGPELRPTTQETLEPVPSSELAAIVVRISEENVDSFIGNMPQRNYCQDRSKAKLVKDKYACQPAERSESGQNSQRNDPTIVAILPSVVHGLSDGGKPSPLVERWKSGGLCDCGGWDVGCSLSVVTNKLQGNGSGVVQSCHTTDGTHRVELFLQGGGQADRPVFSMFAFKEELYTVHFHASIAVLQAFAVCVSILHSRKHTGLCELKDS